MADTAGFFGFDATVSDQVQSWDEDGKNQIDALNDETFGAGAQTSDWETNHKKMTRSEIPNDNLVRALEDLVVKESHGDSYEDPAILSLQKTPIKQLETQIPQSGFYSSPQIDKSIWGQPAPPTIQPPPGFSGPPGFDGPPRVDRDQIPISQIRNSQPLSLEDIERQQLRQKSGIDRAPGAPGGRGSAPGLPPGLSSNSPVDDPAVVQMMVQQPPNHQPQNHQVGPSVLHPQHRRMLEQNRNNQNRNRNNQGRNNQNRRRDPYANLMSKREREWITSMQLRALEIKNPEVEDYYYVNYMKRLLKKGMTQQNQVTLVTPAPKEPRRNRNNSEREENNKDKKEGGGEKEGVENKIKKPWSEGSLGKPVCSSVHNPRKMIEVITKAADETIMSEEYAESELAKLANRRKLFKDIECSFSVLLDLELMVQDELRSFGKEAKKVEELRILIKPEDQFRLLSLLSIRKGKRLIQRILPHLNNNDSGKILTCFINNLALLIKRDIQDEVLPELYDVLSNTINTLEFEKVAEMASRKRHNNLASIARSSFGSSMICKLLDRGQILLSQMSIQEFPADARQAWLDLVKTLTRDMSAVAMTSVLPPLLGVYPALAKALERSRSQKHLISHLNGTRQKAPPGIVLDEPFSY